MAHHISHIHVVLLALLLAVMFSVVEAAPGTTRRVSVSSVGAQGNGLSDNPEISANGRYIVFQSGASNLVSGDDRYLDLFVHDLQAGTVTQVSLASDGTEGNNSSSNAAISEDGRYVAFESYASNLVAGDTNFYNDIFVRDLVTNTTSRVSIATDGTQGNDDSVMPAISADGRYVAFYSLATNLVSDDTNNLPDVFLRDTQTDTTIRVSVASDGAESSGYYFDPRYGFYPNKPTVSADGRFVAFESEATNLVDGDTNNSFDIFVRDTQTGTTSRASVATGGGQANNGSSEPSLSADGRYVLFYSWATNLVNNDTNGQADVFLHDRQTNTTSRVSVATGGAQGNGMSSYPALSADGRFAAFLSSSNNLVSGDSNGVADIFVHDTASGITSRVSVASDGTQANAGSLSPALSGNGAYIGFRSNANNLVNGDTNGASDIFVYELDVTEPLVDAITRVNSNPSSAANIQFRVTFSESVTGVDNNDFLLTTTGITNAAVAGVSGSGATYTVTVNTGSGAGTIRLDVSSTALIEDLQGNALTDLPYTEGELYSIEVPLVNAITRAGANPTNAATVSFHVNFSEPVIGVDSDDFLLHSAGVGSVIDVTGTGAVYTVTAKSGSNGGTLRLDIAEMATIYNLTGKLLEGLPFTSGEVYSILYQTFLPLVNR